MLRVLLGFGSAVVTSLFNVKTEQTPSRKDFIPIEGGLCPLAIWAPLISYSFIQGYSLMSLRIGMKGGEKRTGGRKVEGVRRKKRWEEKSPDSLSSFDEPIIGSHWGEERHRSWSSSQTRIKGNPHLIQMSFECFMVAGALRRGLNKMWL